MFKKLLALLFAVFFSPISIFGASAQEVEPMPVFAVLPRVHRCGLYGFNNDFNTVCINDTSEYCSLPSSAYKSAKNLGFSWQRYSISWYLTNPSPGTFNLTTANFALQSAGDSGIKTWLSIGGAPAWATGGSPWGETFHCMWPAPPNGYRADLPECTNASDYPVNIEAYKTFVHEMVVQYPQVAYFSFGNEFHNPIFWPPGYSKTQEEGHRSAIEQVFRPAYDEVKAANPRAQVVGPDEDSLDSLEMFLEMEAEGIARGNAPLFDVISIHFYGKKVDIAWAIGHRLKPIMDQYGRGRQVWITEFGFPTNSDPDPQVSEQNQANWFSEILPVFEYWLGRENESGWRLTKLFVYRLTDGRWLSSPNQDAPGFGILHGDADYNPRAAGKIFGDFIARNPFLP